MWELYYTILASSELATIKAMMTEPLFWALSFIFWNVAFWIAKVIDWHYS